MRRLSILALAGVAICLGACGAGGLAGDGDGDGDGDCALQAVVQTAQPEVGSSVVVSAEADQPGFQELDWAVRFGDQSISFSAQDPDDRSITFVPQAAGPYTVAVSGSVDGVSCIGDTVTVTAIEPGANLIDYRVRMTPPAGLAAAVTEKSVQVAGGGPYYLGGLDLATGVRATGSVADGGAPLAAQLRARSREGSLVVEGFAADDGTFDFRLPSGAYDVDVLPADPSVAPLRLLDVEATALSQTIDLGGAGTLAGHIDDPAGGALAGARVVLVVDGLPSSVGTSDGSGNFALDARGGGAVARLEVSPPNGSGLPILSADLAAVPTSSIEVAYSAALSVSGRTFQVTAADGSPVPGARVVFLADGIGGAGQASVDGGAAQGLAGRVRVATTADAGGDVSGLALLDAAYVAAVEPAPGGAGLPTRLELDLSGGGDPTVALAAAPATWQAHLQGDAGDLVEGATITARPRGAVASLASATSRATSDAGGDVALALVGGGSYAIQIDPPPGHARTQLAALDAAAAGGSTDAGDVLLAPSQRVTGSVERPGGGAAASVHLAFFCSGCASPEIPVAETVTDAAGRFAIDLPDGGVSP